MTGETEFTQSMMDAAILASQDPGIGLPRLKRGHFTKDAEPLLGLASNLRWNENGLVDADLLGLDPDEFGENGEILPFRYPDRSIEGNYNVTSPITGKTYEFAISALAMLPIDGAVDILPDLPLPDAFANAGEAVAASKRLDVAAAWSPEDVRSAWRALHPESPGTWSYIREIEVDPNSVIVETEVSGAKLTFTRIPFTVNADRSFAFDDENATQVVQTWTPVAATVAASRSVTVARYDNPRSVNRPTDTPTEKETSMDISKLRALLDLPDDATEATVRKAAAEKGITIADTVEFSASGDKDGDASTGTNETPPKPAAVPAEGGEGQGKSVVVPEGFELVDKETMSQVRETIAVAASLRDERDAGRRDAFLDAAVMAGKFAPARKEHFAKLYDADVEGTTEIIGNMAAGLIPVTQEAGVMAGKDAQGVDGQVDAIANAFGVPNIAGGQ